MTTLLHLSDLHITTTDAGTQFDRDVKIRDAMLDDLGIENRKHFAAILITGDIAYNGKADEFARAKEWFEQLRLKTDCPPEAIHVIPGNHDVNRSVVDKESPLWELHQSLRKNMSYETRLTKLDKKLKDPWDFLLALSEYRAFAAAYDCPTDPRNLAWTHTLGDEHRLEDGTIVRLHGLNSALLSDGEDVKANMFLGASQFHQFSSNPGYVNVVLCHHPHSWLMDGNEANDFFRNQAQVVLSGHEHDVRTYSEGNSVRVFAGAVHPNPRESHWEPCYHIINLSITNALQRELVVRTETRVWMDKEKQFGPRAERDGLLYKEHRIVLPKKETAPTTKFEASPAPKAVPVTFVPQAPATHVADDSSNLARRKLIVHFFRLTSLARLQAVIDAEIWQENDDAFDGQERWARVLARATDEGKLSLLWEAVAARDSLLQAEPNPFKT